MAVSASSNTLHFPNENKIISYLKKHPLTKDPYFTEKKIIHKVSKFFADLNMEPEGIQLGVMQTLYDINEELPMEPPVLKLIQMNLIAALKDCANRKVIETEGKKI